MKKLVNRITAFLTVLAITGAMLTGCKSGPKDEAVKAAVETALMANSNVTETAVTVTKGIATFSGKVTDEATKLELGKTVASIPGVKSAVNELVVSPPTVSDVLVATPGILETAVKDATKDFPTVMASVNDGVVTLKGEIQKANLQKLMMALNALKPKKVDNSQLVIK